MENHIILWIWIISATVVVIWYQCNPEFLKGYYERSFQNYDYESYLIILYIATIIIAPIMFVDIVIGETKKFIMVLQYKRKLKRKIRKLKDEDAAKFLRDELDKIT